MTRPGTRVFKAKHARGMCRGCQREHALRRDGMLVWHYGDRRGKHRASCSGTGLQPFRIGPLFAKGARE